MHHTISNILRFAATELELYSDTPRLDAEVLLAYVLGENRTYLYTWPEREVTEKQNTQFMQLVRRRSQGEPIAYITGQQEFWSMTLKVPLDTLIPRPETELLVELALQRIPTAIPQTILDLGAGSGAIALALAKERPQCQVIGIDRSIQALTICQENAKSLDIRNVSFQPGHWLREFSGTAHMIVSNPPYIKVGDPHLGQGDVRFEPRSALSSGPQGLDDIHEIADTARNHLHAGGWLLLEHGYDQRDVVIKLLQQLGYKNINDHQDLAGQARAASAQFG